jgi:hypothetical protein
MKRRSNTLETIGAIDQDHAAEDVDLPQRHRRLAFPAPLVAALAPPSGRLDQSVAAQDAVHRRLPPWSVALPAGPGHLAANTLDSISTAAWCGLDGGWWSSISTPVGPTSDTPASHVCKT